MDAVVVFTERDELNTRAVARGTSVVRIPFAVNPPPTPVSAIGTGGPSLLFVGNFVHPPNVDAAVRLATGIFPLVRHHRPDVTMTLVGPSPPPSLIALASDGITITGRVVDVTPYLNEASVIIVPIRLGGGMRVKVIEALAAGKAVVASPRAVEGLTFPAEPPLVIADSDEALASAALQLLCDPSRRQALGSSAREWALQSPSVGDRAAAYDRLHAALLARNSRVPRSDWRAL
jgi:glycosyltransferase involved in cell wall biosynthesis